MDDIQFRVAGVALHTVVPMLFRTRTVGTGKGHQVRMESQNTSCLIKCKPKQGVPKAVFFVYQRKNYAYLSLSTPQQHCSGAFL